MNWNASYTRRSGRIVALLGLTAVLVALSAGRPNAQSNGSGGPADLVGTWAVQVTLRNCASGAPLGPAFHSLVTLHAGGTISESTVSPAFAVGQRGPAHGTWTRTGHGTYRQRMAAQIAFDTAPNLPGTPGFNPSLPVSPGFFAGWSVVTHTIRVADANHFTSAGTNEFYKSDLTVYRTGCSSAVATRFR